nr:restriction endonuclease subunit S [Bacteroides fragilis]
MMELKKYNANHTKVLKINQIVRTVSETHRFDKDKLIAINTSDVENGVMGSGTLTSVDELKGQFKKTIVKDDILFSEIRPANRRFAKVTTEDTKDYVVSTKLMVLRKYNEDVDLEYFYYCLTNQPFLDILQRRAENRIGSFPQITFDLLSEYAFPIPPISEQKRISSVISTLDKKIALNRAINQNLETMAKQLYDYWFVQFDFPNEEGKPYKSSGGEMVWNEKLKRDIPASWKTKAIEDIADVYNGATPSTVNEQNYGGDIVWITPKDLSDQKQKFVYLGERNISQAGYNSCSTHLLPPNTILMSSRAPIGLLSIAKTELCTNQGFKNFVPKAENISTYLYYYLNIHIRQIEQLGTGTTFKEVSREDVLKFPILKPSDTILDLWEERVSALNNKQFEIQKEKEYLTKQRDGLLPLLMNGQVSVNSDLSHD